MGRRFVGRLQAGEELNGRPRAGGSSSAGRGARGEEIRRLAARGGGARRPATRGEELPAIDGRRGRGGSRSRCQRQRVGAAAAASRGAVDESFKAMRMQDIVTDAVKLGFQRADFDDVIRSFCWYYSTFFSKQAATTVAPPKDDEQAKKTGATISDELTLLDCLHASLVSPSEGAAASWGRRVKGGKTSRIRTANVLHCSGVRLMAMEEGLRVV
uniref:Uncharacterized protein n=1 Tax=Oryza meridionalis TaxID=40149 RepID=A0A0E0CVI1_9ORYZ